MTLVLAFGNPLREDDGVGWAVAEALLGDARFEVRAVHQLLPELAEEVSREGFVVFVDACCGGPPGEVKSTPVTPAEGVWSGSHALDPASLLGLCRRYYGRAPRAVLVSVAGACFGFGDELSQEVRRAVPCAVSCVTSELPLPTGGEGHGRNPS